MTVDHIGHCSDLFPSVHLTTVGYVPPALKRRGNPQDFFLKTGNDRGRRVLLNPVGHFSASDIQLAFIVATFQRQSNGSKKHISILLSHFRPHDLFEEQGITRYFVNVWGHIETRNNVVITHTSTAVVTTGFNTPSGIYGDSTACQGMYSNINQAPIQIMHGTTT